MLKAEQTEKEEVAWLENHVKQIGNAFEGVPKELRSMFA
jgi:hypothetical protein